LIGLSTLAATSRGFGDVVQAILDGTIGNNIAYTKDCRGTPHEKIRRRDPEGDR